MGKKLKLLVIGIDGADARVIDGMPMPFLQNLLASGKNYDARVDLWSRGWAEIFTGKHGRDTGAFYHRPTCAGKYEFTESFNLNCLAGNEAVRPIWDELSDKGFRVGVMNIPTTLPAPEVNGFFVSGVGGGSDKSGENSIPPEACYPTSVKKTLEENGYILDIRRAKSGITDLPAFFQKIKDMEKKRTESFIHLAEAHQIDFGFVGYVGLSRVCYLLMADILELISNTERETTEAGRLIQDFFSYQDELLKELVRELSPEGILLVSDHGMAPYTHNVNLNAFLVERGWQKRNESMNGWIREAGKAMKKCLPVRFRRKLGKKIPAVRQFVGGQNYIPDQTTAIATRYISGIYLNDRRFGGPPVTDGITDEIVKSFNEYEAAKRHGMTAVSYASKYKGCHSECFLPDIWIEHPDSIFFTDAGPFVAPNPQYKPFDTFAYVVSDMNSGIKGTRPIFCLAGDAPDEELETSGNGDLTQAYELIRKYMR